MTTIIKELKTEMEKGHKEQIEGIQGLRIVTPQASSAAGRYIIPAS